MDFKRLLNNPYIGLIISVIVGFGLATLFRKSCNMKNCYVFKGPPIREIENKVFQSGDNCYKYTYNHTSCKKNGFKIIDFSNNDA